MPFASITRRIADILRDNATALAADLEHDGLEILACRPYAHAADQVVFVWREGISETGYGASQLDGAGTWIVATYVRFTGAEETAENELSKLAGNLIGVLGKLTYRTGTTYQSLVITDSTTDTMTGPDDVSYIGERFPLAVRWAKQLS